MANENADGIDLYADVDDFGMQEQEYHEGDIYDDMLGTRSSLSYEGNKYSSVPIRQNSIGKNYALYVSNLTWWTSDKDLIDALMSIGISDIIEIKFHENRVNGQSKGFATVVVSSEISQKAIIDKLPKREIHGQKVYVMNCTSAALKQLDISARKDIAPSNGQPSHMAMPTQMPQSQPHLKNLLPPPPIRPLQNHPTSQLLTQPPPGQFVLQGGVLQQNQPRLLLPNQTPNTALPPPSLNQPPPQLPMQPPVIVRQPFQATTSRVSGDFAAVSQQPPPSLPHQPPLNLAQQPPHRLSALPPHSTIVRSQAVIGLRVPGNIDIREGFQQPPPAIGQMRQPIVLQQLPAPHGMIGATFNQTPQSLQHPPPQQQPPPQQHLIAPPQQAQHFGQQGQHLPPHNSQSNQHFVPQPHHRPINSQSVPLDQFGRPLPGYPVESFNHGLRATSSHSLPVQGVQVSSHSSTNTSISDTYIKDQQELSDKDMRRLTSPSLIPSPVISDLEFDDILHRNKTVSSSAISRAVLDASNGEYASAIETLVTAISLIKQSKIASDDRCRILISSLQGTLQGIEAKSYGSKSSGLSRSERRTRSPRERSDSDRMRGRDRSRSREHKRSKISRDKDRHYDKNSIERDYYREKEYKESRRH